MPTNAPITLLPPVLPEGYCFQTWQKLATDFFGLASAFLPGAYNTFNYGNTEPSPDDRSKPWFRTNNDGTPDKWYIYATGNWLSLFPVPVDYKTLYIYIGTEADLKTKDGGEDASVSAKTGPFWQLDTTLAAKFPVCTGTWPSGDVIHLGETGGEEKHALIPVENAAHNHDVVLNGASGAGGQTGVEYQAAVGINNVTYTTTVSGSGQAHNNIPPYYGVYLIKRTARLFWRI